MLNNLIKLGIDSYLEPVIFLDLFNIEVFSAVIEFVLHLRNLIYDLSKQKKTYLIMESSKLGWHLN